MATRPRSASWSPAAGIVEPSEHDDDGAADRHDLEAAVTRTVADLTSGIAFHRDTLASLSVDRITLAETLSHAEAGLQNAPMGSDHHRRVASVAESLRGRLASVDSAVATATRALADCERCRDALVAALPDSAGDGATPDATAGGGRQLFQVVEDERMRIARDMHDGPAQVLANLVLKAEIVERYLDHDPTMVRGELADFKAIVRVALEETRKLIFDLRPMTLDDLGLVPTLRKFLGDFEEQWGITCRLTVLGTERRIDRDHEAAIFRIVQEACTNARKHAMATVIDVTVSASPRRVTATVKDDGRGFDVQAAEAEALRTSHLGLTSMRERATLSGAALDISSAPGRGTSIRVSLTT